SETRLITHGHAIEHVTGRGPATAGVSLGALIEATKRLRPENPGGDRGAERLRVWFWGRRSKLRSGCVRKIRAATGDASVHSPPAFTGSDKAGGLWRGTMAVLSVCTILYIQH